MHGARVAVLLPWFAELYSILLPEAVGDPDHALGAVFVMIMAVVACVIASRACSGR